MPDEMDLRAVTRVAGMPAPAVAAGSLPHLVTHREHHLDRVLAQLLDMLLLCRQACIPLGYRAPWFTGV